MEDYDKFLYEYLISGPKFMEVTINSEKISVPKKLFQLFVNNDSMFALDALNFETSKNKSLGMEICSILYNKKNIRYPISTIEFIDKYFFPKDIIIKNYLNAKIIDIHSVYKKDIRLLDRIGIIHFGVDKEFDGDNVYYRSIGLKLCHKTNDGIHGDEIYINNRFDETFYKRSFLARYIDGGVRDFSKRYEECPEFIYEMENCKFYPEQRNMFIEFLNMVKK